MITMPDSSVISFDDCLDNLKHTRDFSLYLDTLTVLKDGYVIIFSVKDTIGTASKEVINKLHKLGFSDIIFEHHKNYIGIMEKGNILFDFSNKTKDAPIEFSTEVNGHSLYVLSEAHGSGNSKIIINNEDFSLNGRGFNIVVFDSEKNEVIDSSVYDSAIPKPTFFHKNLELSREYFDTHFFVPDKYKAVWKEPFEKQYFSNHKLVVKEIENGTVLPLKPFNGRKCGGACDENYNLISGYDDYSHDAVKDPHYIYYTYTPNNEEMEYIDETVIYGGLIFEHPGHLLLQTAANKLWYLTQNTDPNIRIAVIYRSWGFEPKSFLMELIEAFGIDKNRIISVTKPTKFKKLIVPDSSEMMYIYSIPYFFTKEYQYFFEHIKNTVQPGNTKKIYLTKTKGFKQNVIGEEFFIDFYKQHGYEIIDPEDYTMAEKASLMLGAEEVATTTGTNHLFSIFCKASTKITILSRVDNTPYGTATEGMICEAMHCKNLYIVNIAAGFFHKDYVWGMCLLCVTDEFKRYVKEFFGEELNVSTEESLKNVLFDYFKTIPEYYSNPMYFNYIKNQSILTLLQNISELFCNKDFDTSKLNVSQNDFNLAYQNKKLSDKNNLAATNLDFQALLIHDFFSKKQLKNYFAQHNYSSVALICNDARITGILTDIFNHLGIKLLCSSSASRCADILADWDKFKKADTVLYYFAYKVELGVRDNIVPVPIRDIIEGKFSPQLSNSHINEFKHFDNNISLSETNETNSTIRELHEQRNLQIILRLRAEEKALKLEQEIQELKEKFKR